MTDHAMTDLDERYLDILIGALRVCREYRPKLGHGRKHGYSLAEFRTLYGADPFYSCFGLDSPLLYSAHRAAGGMTSIYRQIGIGCQWVFSALLQDHLSLTADEASWSYTVRAPGGRTRTLRLDARIPLASVRRAKQRRTVADWVDRAAADLGLRASSRRKLDGTVFEVRQGYKSKDAKRQNADVANASKAYANNYLPVVVLLSTQIDEDVAERYRGAGWLLLVGTTAGSDLESTYAFCRNVVGYDLQAFFEQNSARLHAEVEAILEEILG